jgi:S1-C subfamily serine protease
MRHWIVPLVAVVAISPSLAGGEHCNTGASLAKAGVAHEKCSMSTEDCRQAMAVAAKRGWAGLELDKSDGKLVVTKVYPTSPAARAGFLVGDVLLALNGVALTEENHDKLAKIKSTMTPGTEVLYNVARKGETRHLSVALAKMPTAVYDEMVAKHMAEHDGTLATN